ncbi:hypothetical protein D3C77_392350 [compost metagenome]
MVFIERANGVVNEYILQLIKGAGLAFARLGDIENSHRLIQKGVENTPNELTLFTFGKFDIRGVLLVTALQGEGDFAKIGTEVRR